MTGFYTYYVEDSGAAPDGNGWYDDDGNKVAVEIGTGIGVLFESDAVKVQVSGQVAKGTVEVTELNAGFTYVCNPTPVERSLQAFTPTGESAGFGGEAVQTFDETNDVTGFYTYYIEDSGAAPDGNGWYDDDGVKVEDVIFAPGQGFLFESSGDCTITVPAAA